MYMAWHGMAWHGGERYSLRIGAWHVRGRVRNIHIHMLMDIEGNMSMDGWVLYNPDSGTSIDEMQGFVLQFDSTTSFDEAGFRALWFLITRVGY